MRWHRGDVSLALILYLAGGLMVAVLFAIAVKQIYDAGYSAAEVECQKAAQEQRDKEAKQGNEASTKLEADNAKAKVVYRTITRTVDKYIDRPVYRDCALDADGLRDASAALAGALTPAREPDRGVPKPLPAVGRDARLNAAEADRSR